MKNCVLAGIKSGDYSLVDKFINQMRMLYAPIGMCLKQEMLEEKNYSCGGQHEDTTNQIVVESISQTKQTDFEHPTLEIILNTKTDKQIPISVNEKSEATITFANFYKNISFAEERNNIINRIKEILNVTCVITSYAA